MTLSDIAGQSWDLIVVGAGPAGATAAFLLAKQGFRILLVDKADFPRFKVCGCCLNANALATLNRLGLSDTVKEGIAYHWLNLAAQRRSATIPLPAGVSISREVWDWQLVQKANQAGVHFLPDTTAALAVVDSPDHRVLNLRQGEEHSQVKARIVLAADGLAGELIGHNHEAPTHVQSFSRIGAGTMLHYDCSDYPPGTIHMSIGRGGYVGVVRLNDQLVIAAAFDGAAMTSAGGMAQLAAAIMREAGAAPLPVEDCKWKGTAPLTRRRSRPGGFRTFALGDAIGYIEPFTGEGMAWALTSAEAIVPVVCLAMQHWNDRLIDRWKAGHRRLIGRRQWVCRLLSRWLRYPALVSPAIALAGFAPAVFQPLSRAVNLPSAHMEH